MTLPAVAAEEKEYKMKKTALFILLIISLSVTSAFASDYTGTDPATPGYSAQDVQNQNLSAGDGIYWIDPDLPGGNAPGPDALRVPFGLDVPFDDGNI